MKKKIVYCYKHCVSVSFLLSPKEVIMRSLEIIDYMFRLWSVYLILCSSGLKLFIRVKFRFFLTQVRTQYTFC